MDYQEDHHNYRVWLPEKQRIIHSHGIVFNENCFPLKGSNSTFLDSNEGASSWSQMIFFLNHLHSVQPLKAHLISISSTTQTELTQVLLNPCLLPQTQLFPRGSSRVINDLIFLLINQLPLFQLPPPLLLSRTSVHVLTQQILCLDKLAALLTGSLKSLLLHMPSLILFPTLKPCLDQTPTNGWRP